ncbi:cytochrome P450 [Terriglobus albidus]|uniref:cytochrome P450 n=1 Tax=Terriglobus albidus TaxID=1592106 RepID=UPI0021DFDDCF|nr:cytochrome P450 [Terriglobus albidus]
MSYQVEHAEGLLSFLRFGRNRLHFVAGMARRGIDVSALRMGSKRIYVINHPDLIRDVLVTHESSFTKGAGLEAMKPIFGEGLLTSEGELHGSQRRLVQPVFQHGRIARFGATMVQCAEAHQQRWADGQQVAMDLEMMQLSLRVLGLTLLGADSDGADKNVSQALILAYSLFTGFNPMVALFAPARKRFERRAAFVRSQVDRVLTKVIDEHRRNPEAYSDVLSMLLESFGDSMPEHQLRDEVLTLFLAGYGTSSIALTWAWFLLALHPDVGRRMQAELDAVLGKSLPTFEHLPQLEYTGWVFREVLRLYPPAWMIAREPIAPYMLGEIAVPAGSMITMSSYATQRDSRFWQKPEDFDPERWQPVGQRSRPQFAYFPFGAASRSCMGEHFAIMQGVLVLATLAQQWSPALLDGQQVELRPQITLRPKESIHFSLKRR